jgi:glycosyltransferase involved in cell wall biosynthesis
MNGRMRIGFDATSLVGPRSGIGRYAGELLTALVRELPDERFVLLAHRRPALDPTLAGHPSVARLRGPEAPSRLAWIHLVLPVELAAARLDVCHFANYQAPLRVGTPVVLTLHDLSLLERPAEHPRRRALVMAPVLRRTVRRAAAVVTPSRAVREDALRVLDLPPDRVHVVPEAPAAIFRRLHDEAELARVAAAHGLEPGFLLHVGTLQPRKNLVRLVDAFARLRASGFARSLVLAGAPGWGTAALRRRVARPDVAGAVRLLGYVPDRDLVALLSLAGAVAVPSLHEGFGLPALEALACGVPTVVSDRGGLPEVVGEAALVVDPLDTSALADGLQQALEEGPVRCRLAHGGPARADAFSWSVAARTMAGIYQAAAGRAA